MNELLPEVRSFAEAYFKTFQIEMDTCLGGGCGAVTYHREKSFPLVNYQNTNRADGSLGPGLRRMSTINTNQEGAEGVLTLSQTLLSSVEKWQDISKFGTRYRTSFIRCGARWLTTTLRVLGSEVVSIPPVYHRVIVLLPNAWFSSTVSKTRSLGPPVSFGP